MGLLKIPRLLLLIGTGCGVFGCSSTTGPTVPVQSPLFGVWVKTILQADRPPATAFKGNWRLQFTNDGRYIYGLDGRHDELGTYQIFQNQITLIETGGSLPCRLFTGGSPLSGRYRFEVTDTTMTFVRDLEPCLPREYIFSGKIWKKS